MSRQSTMQRIQWKQPGQTPFVLPTVEKPVFEGGELFKEPVEREGFCHRLREAAMAFLMMLGALVWMGS